MADSVHDVLTEMAANFDADAWGDEDAVLQFNISGDGGGKWYATIEGGALSLEEGTADSPAMTMICSDEDLLAMVNGELNAISAFMQGRIKIDGNMSLAMKLQKLLT
jgi:putative sterol carrier protein